MTKKRKKLPRSPRKPIRRRAAPAAAPQAERVVEIPLTVADVQPALATLRDTNRPVENRLEALQSIQAASFAVADFDSIRPDYIAALRQVAEDHNHELRQRALGILAREHDGFAQEVLLEGLRDPNKALVAPEKALQLLSYDPHAAVYPIAREMVKTASDVSTRREALRVLAGDPSSAPVLEELLSDKNEPTELRRMSASALHALNPDRLQRWANRAVLDTNEDDDLLATGLTALTQFGDAEAIVRDTRLRNRMNQLQQKGPAKIKRIAKRFVEKYDV